MMFNFRQRIKEGKPLVGTLQALNSPEVTEILVSAGFDWLWIDLEHSTIDVEGAQRILQAAGNNCPCVLRVPGGDQVWIKKLLDIGPAGVIIPQVKSAREASEIVQFCRYPPEGTRSVGLSRAHGYGMRFREYVANANQNVAVIMQIEHIDAVKEIEAIVKIQGIDALLIGPYDLSGTMGKIGQVNDPEVQKQIDRVRQVCLHTGMPLGIFTTNPEEVKTFIEQGYIVIAVGIDTMFLGKSLEQALQIIKQ
ncbi:MAG: 2,4-dihydroxyhept-2-ene-1,7-dioic acid aldolase [Candidatus Aminicenantes bacterium]|nr:MAG: 2,4-dihydroxyhept-2-ene-1,7-dioic acid aldolase [Candidatus Aminicenantes bacterium]